MSELIKMKQGLLITSLVLVVLLITGCMPAAPNGERRSSSEAEVTPDTTANSGSTTTSNSGEVLYWYSSAQKVTGTITLNADQQDIVYLRGDAIHNFLINNSNYQNTYCLVVNFNESGMKQLRARATPISFNNFNTGMLERLFRIDLPSKSANQASCDGTIDSTITGAGAFILSDICLTCTTKANSSTINLYESIGGINDLSVIPRTTLDISSIGMRVDLSSNSSSVISQCTNSSCSAKGFDCCLSGQCVNDAALKPNASSESNYYQAVADVTSDPNQFIHYPNVYFICGHHVVPTPVDPTPVNPEEEANARLATKVKQYKCLKGYPSTTPYSNCEHTECATNGNSDCFDEVRKQIWIECGCEKTPTPDDPDNYYCPDLSLRAYDAADELIDQIISSSTFSKVECDIPANDADPAPFQKLNVTVPGNSAPHRFFCKSDGGTNCSAGEAVDDINTISGQDIEPEGAEFFYLDPDAQIDPINGSFNINHILGQFSTTLTEAKPAKVVTVEFNQAYVISTTTGYYTPCPSCAKDSWYDNFSSFPVSRMGVGLQNIGYTTKRDRYNSNTTHGNYEDTIFGRACFVPPTMIPFSHTPNSDLATQRENRLATQTALFVNGYQRDWYGFNLGALIGSFDGVTWFAIGKTRRIISTSTKLFLAINAPFADLALTSDLVVDITVDNGDATAANYDYNPNLTLGDARQNQAGSCQANHMCQRDIDCITRLGWEYRCADISKLRTNWPTFDINGVEVTNSELANVGFASVVHGNLPTGSSKRCVYRGAGAICKQNYAAGLIDSAATPLLTCAPNFYCADISSAVFNHEVVREPEKVELFLFGQDSNVLGRPSKYLLATTALTSSTIQQNLADNGLNMMSSTGGELGLCRPGRNLASVVPASDTYLTQHQSADGSNRTDYINQIASCDITGGIDNRVHSCPVVITSGTQESNSDYGNYLLESSNFSEHHKQNSCGQEAMRDSSTNSFAPIEAEVLGVTTSLLLPTVAKDACLRRAGSVCHTDLDCSPNHLHAKEASFLSDDYFGGTEAERNYWEESLVCGQAETAPSTAQDSNYSDYDMSNNRCCRAQGESITIFTQTDSSTTIPDVGSANLTLVTSGLSYNDTTAAGRYSRYSIVDLNTGNPPSSPLSQQPLVNSGQTPYPYQWKTFNDTARRTCCGGGFVRQFSDGGHDWTNLNRLSLDTSKFKCLNYENILTMVDTADSFSILNVKEANYSGDSDKFCLSPADGNIPYDGGCSQVQIRPPNGSKIIYPQEVLLSSGTNATYGRATLNTALDSDLTSRRIGKFTPYMPVPYIPDESQVGLNWSEESYMTSATGWNVGFYLPAYIGGISNIVPGSVKIKYYKSGALVDTKTDAVVPTTCATQPAANNACIDQDENGRQYMLAAADHAATNWSEAGVEFEFYPINSANYVWGASATAPDNSLGMQAGNALYYLTKLGRLELSGIPQIFYEPIYCNSARDRLVDGIFKVDANSSAFNSAAFNYTPANNNNLSLGSIYDVDGTSGSDISNSSEQVVFQDQLALSQVFSGHKVQCCLSLGMEANSSADCCSNFSVKIDEVSGDTTVSKRYCKLPVGADLHLYFNRFVSGDGVGSDQPGGGLTDDDFIPATGELKISNAVDIKMASLAEEYCEGGKYRRGAAFGYFYAEPYGGMYLQDGDKEDGRYYSIVDSILDSEGIDIKAKGYVRFHEGFRWNHHMYCL